MTIIKIFFKKKLPNATAPAMIIPGSCCYDLFSAEAKIILPNNRTSIDTGICLKFPENNMYGQIQSRSGIALKNWVDVCAGMIDSNYTGSIMVILHNYHPTDSFTVNVGDRIAQIEIKREFNKDIEFIEDMNCCKEWDQTERGECGFGSSGK